MHTNCLNCGHTLHKNELFCHSCGQKTSTSRLHFGHIVEELVHAFTHADKGVFFLIKELAIRPGHVAREYIEGKRKKYFNPFNFLLLSAAVFAFFTIHFHVLDPFDNNPVSQFLTHYSNLILILGVPLLSLFSWWLFKKSTLNFSESLVLNAYLVGEINLFYDIIIAPLIVAFRESYMILLYVYLLVWIIYYCWAATTFFKRRNVGGVIRGIAVVILYQFFTGFFAYAIYYIYRQFAG